MHVDMDITADGTTLVATAVDVTRGIFTAVVRACHVNDTVLSHLEVDKSLRGVRLTEQVTALVNHTEVFTNEVSVVTSANYLVLDGKTFREDIVDSVAVGTWLYVHVTTVAAAEEAADDSSCE